MKIQMFLSDSELPITSVLILLVSARRTRKDNISHRKPLEIIRSEIQ